MQFLKCAQVALLVSGAVFATASLPMVQLSGQRVNVEVNRSVVFSGEFRALAGGYLSLAALVSLSLGTAGFSLAAWRQTGSLLKQSQKKVSELEALVAQREEQLQQSQLSGDRFQASGLQHFLQEDWEAAEQAQLPGQAPHQPLLTTSQLSHSAPVALAEDLSVAQDSSREVLATAIEQVQSAIAEAAISPVPALAASSRADLPAQAASSGHALVASSASQHSLSADHAAGGSNVTSLRPRASQEQLMHQPQSRYQGQPPSYPAQPQYQAQTPYQQTSPQEQPAYPEPFMSEHESQLQLVQAQLQALASQLSGVSAAEQALLMQQATPVAASEQPVVQETRPVANPEVRTEPQPVASAHNGSNFVVINPYQVQSLPQRTASQATQRRSHPVPQHSYLA